MPKFPISSGPFTMGLFLLWAATGQAIQAPGAPQTAGSLTPSPPDRCLHLLLVHRALPPQPELRVLLFWSCPRGADPHNVSRIAGRPCALICCMTLSSSLPPSGPQCPCLYMWLGREGTGTRLDHVTSQVPSRSIYGLRAHKSGTTGF